MSKPTVPIRQVGRAQQLIEKQRRAHCRHLSSSYPYQQFKSAYCKDCGQKLREPDDTPDDKRDGAGGSGGVKPKDSKKAKPDNNAGGSGGKKVAKKGGN